MNVLTDALSRLQLEKIPTTGTRGGTRAGAHAKPSVKNIRSTVNRLIAASVAENTKCCVQKCIIVLKKIRSAYQLTHTWPVPVAQLVLYISYLFEMGYAPSSITTYVCGIQFYLKMNNCQIRQNHLWSVSLLEGCRRSRKYVDVRAPITETILQRLVAALRFVCFSHYEMVLFRAAFTLAYFGLLRVGEMVLPLKHMQTGHY